MTGGVAPIPSFRTEWNGDPESMSGFMDSRVRGNDVGGWRLFRHSGRSETETRNPCRGCWIPAFAGMTLGVAPILSFRTEWNGDPESMPGLLDSHVRGNDVGVMPIPSFRTEWNGDPESMPRLLDSRIRGYDVGVAPTPSFRTE